MKIKWDDWRGPVDGKEKDAVLFIKRLFEWRGYRLDLHKMAKADPAGAFHTHPSKALRIILRGGYIEQVWVELPQAPAIAERPLYPVRRFVAWAPGRVGIVTHDYCHRIHRLREGPSYSLWLRWPVTHDVRCVGPGWPRDHQGKFTPERN